MLVSKRVFIALIACWLCACSPPDNAPLPTLFLLDTAPTPTPANGPDPRPLAFWQPVTGSLGADAADLWTFNGEAGDDITLRVIGQGEVIPTLRVTGPDNTALGEGDIVRAVLPADGLYTVRVSAPAATAYDLGLRYTGQTSPLDSVPTAVPQVVGVPTPQPAYARLGVFMAELNHNQTVGGVFDFPDERHVYTFAGEAGGYVTIELNRVSGASGARLRLFNAQGEPLALDASSGENANALLRNIRLPEDGLYTVQAESRAPGGYALRLLQLSAPAPVTPTVIITPTATPERPVLNPTLMRAVSGERLRERQIVVDQLDTPSSVNRHAFYVEAGTIFTVGVRPINDTPLIPRVELIDPNGIPAAAVIGDTSPNNREAVMQALVAEESGPYTVFVTAEGETFGDYVIGYGIGSTWIDARRGETLADRVAEGRIRRSGVREIWYAYLVAGDLITATVTPLSATLVAVLALVGPDGTLLGIDRESGGARTPQITGVRIPTTGIYTFTIWAAAPETIGEYALAWRYVDVAPTPTPPEGTLPVLVVDDRVGDQEYRFYPFQGQAGQRVRVRVLAVPGTGFDPVAALLAPDASIIAEGDDGDDGDLNPLFEATLPVSGTYNVRVNGYQTGGAFTLIVEALY